MERRVEASASMHASSSSALTVLRTRPELVLGHPESEMRARPRTFRTAVAARLSPGTTVEQAVTITLGPLDSANDDQTTTAAFAWEPIGLERLLPSFAGDLSLTPGDESGSRLSVRGSYRAPMGPVGRFGDSVIGHRIARQSLTLFVDRLAEGIDREAIRRHTASSVRPAPYNEDLRPHSRSEHHLG